MSTSGAAGMNGGGVGGINTDQRQAAPGFDGGDSTAQPGESKPDPAEEGLVTKLWKQYDDARKFDENFRKQVAIDRRYAAGTADLSWAVSTNLIGAFIDILTSLLYARDPDVSVKKSPQVDESSTHQTELFARTLEIVISLLWKKGKLKKAARKGVRSVLSNSEGWFKATLMSEKTPQPEAERALNDARETMARLEAQQKLLEDPDGQDPETIEAELDEKKKLIADLQQKLEVAVSKLFVIDYVPTENIQVSTDITSISDYLDADWIANELFIPKEDALERFTRLSPGDIKTAKTYYQKTPKELTTRELDNVLPQGTMTAESAQAYTQSTSEPNSPAFVRTVELWDRRDKQIRTMIDGVKKWAKEPYTPPYPTSRFYPYFFFCFFEVDGERHPQSLSWRLYKLQDEYSATRSNFRLTRERSIPGILFNATMLDETEARKLEGSKAQEYTALRPADPATPIGNLFAPKPVQGIDPRLYDPTFILNDMERLSGVQEALSSAINGPGNPRTATEANIQQAGTNARTTADRDALEEMLSDLAQYTAEQALQCLEIRDVQRIAGDKAFWPKGMDIEDIHTLVEIQIAAGTTGKPKSGSDQQSWATILPLIKQTLGEIRAALAAGDKATADALIELIKETMLRMGDESDPERFIPRVPPPGSPGAGAPPMAPPPKVTVALKGELGPDVAARLVAPTLALYAAATPPPGPAPGGSPSAPASQAPGGPATMPPPGAPPGAGP
jgi:hypothetical protein